MTARSRTFLVFLLLAAAAATSLFASLALGSVPVGGREIIDALAGGSGIQQDIVRLLRLPRALAAFAVGGLLALAGALMQVLLRNPLADPYVLGLSGGAAVGALGGMLAGLGALAVNLGASAGALLAAALVFAFARRDFARQQLSGALDARLTAELLRAPDPFRWVLPLLHTCMPEDTRNVR